MPKTIFRQYSRTSRFFVFPAGIRQISLGLTVRRVSSRTTVIQPSRTSSNELIVILVCVNLYPWELIAG